MATKEEVIAEIAMYGDMTGKYRLHDWHTGYKIVLSKGHEIWAPDVEQLLVHLAAQLPDETDFIRNLNRVRG
jgi:hypothetical protein